MNTHDAFSILNIQSDYADPATIKAAYRQAVRLYHPDHNPAGLEMMKLINQAYELLKNFSGKVERLNHKNYGTEINKALNAIITLGLQIEVCGAWVWVSGNTKVHRDILKAAGYRWSAQKERWYFRPAEYKARRHDSWSMEEIRKKYGSEALENEQKHVSFRDIGRGFMPTLWRPQA